MLQSRLGPQPTREISHSRDRKQRHHTPVAHANPKYSEPDSPKTPKSLLERIGGHPTNTLSDPVASVPRNNVRHTPAAPLFPQKRYRSQSINNSILPSVGKSPVSKADVDEFLRGIEVDLLSSPTQPVHKLSTPPPDPVANAIGSLFPSPALLQSIAATPPSVPKSLPYNPEFKQHVVRAVTLNAARRPDVPKSQVQSAAFQSAAGHALPSSGVFESLLRSLNDTQTDVVHSDEQPGLIDPKSYLPTPPSSAEWMPMPAVPPPNASWSHLFPVASDLSVDEYDPAQGGNLLNGRSSQPPFVASSSFEEGPRKRVRLDNWGGIISIPQDTPIHKSVEQGLPSPVEPEFAAKSSYIHPERGRSNFRNKAEYWNPPSSDTGYRQNHVSLHNDRPTSSSPKATRRGRRRSQRTPSHERPKVVSRERHRVTSPERRREYTRASSPRRIQSSPRRRPSSPPSRRNDKEARQKSRFRREKSLSPPPPRRPYSRSARSPDPKVIHPLPQSRPSLPSRAKWGRIPSTVREKILHSEWRSSSKTKGMQMDLFYGQKHDAVPTASASSTADIVKIEPEEIDDMDIPSLKHASIEDEGDDVQMSDHGEKTSNAPENRMGRGLGPMSDTIDTGQTTDGLILTQSVITVDADQEENPSQTNPAKDHSPGPVDSGTNEQQNTSEIDMDMDMDMGTPQPDKEEIVDLTSRPLLKDGSILPNDYPLYGTAPGMWLFERGLKQPGVTDTKLVVHECTHNLAYHLYSFPSSAFLAVPADKTMISRVVNNIVVNSEVVWPKHGSLIFQVENSSGLTNILPKQLVPGYPVELVLAPGENSIRFVQLRPMGDYTFVLQASSRPPLSADIDSAYPGPVDGLEAYLTTNRQSCTTEQT